MRNLSFLPWTQYFKYQALRIKWSYTVLGGGFLMMVSWKSLSIGNLFTQVPDKKMKDYFITIQKCITLEIILNESHSSSFSFFDKCDVETSCDNVNGLRIQSNILYEVFRNNDEVLICRYFLIVLNETGEKRRSRREKKKIYWTLIWARHFSKHNPCFSSFNFYHNLFCRWQNRGRGIALLNLQSSHSK